MSSIHAVTASARASPSVVTNNSPVSMKSAFGKCCTTARASSLLSRFQIASAMASATASINSIEASFVTMPNGPPVNHVA